jgi:ADP-ribose pyrophosphatase|tara:strand:- start:846 stop:1427 length:582 start_codon:yes stop_codon:yes gene_type:complete
MSTKYNIIKKKKIHDGFFKLHELTFTHQKHNGKWSSEIKREIFSGAHVATVIPYDPINKKILLLEQFRSGLLHRKDDPVIIEIVAGIIDEGELPEDAAQRECIEETGCSVKKLKKILSYYPAPGSSESFYHLFLAEVESFEGKRIVGQKDENEDILVGSYGIDEVRNLMKRKKIINGVTLIALQWFFLEYYKD